MSQEKFIISSEQVSDYVVCPESWRLKHLEGKKKNKVTPREKEGIEKRKEWLEHHEKLAIVKKYAKIVYLLLICLVIIVFMLEQDRTSHTSTSHSDNAHSHEQAVQ